MSIASKRVYTTAVARLGGRSIGTLGLEDCLSLLELYQLSLQLGGPSAPPLPGVLEALGALKDRVATLHSAPVPAVSLPATTAAAMAPPPVKEVESGGASPHPAPKSDLLASRIQALQRLALLKSSSRGGGRDASAATDLEDDTPEVIERRKAELLEEVSGLVQRLKQGGLATNDTLVSGNASLGATNTLADGNLAAVSSAAGALTEEHKMAWGHTFSLCALIVRGVVAFLLAYVAITFLAKPTPIKKSSGVVGGGTSTKGGVSSPTPSPFAKAQYATPSFPSPLETVEEKGTLAQADVAEAGITAAAAEVVVVEETPSHLEVVEATPSFSIEVVEETPPSFKEVEATPPSPSEVVEVTATPSEVVEVVTASPTEVVAVVSASPIEVGEAFAISTGVVVVTNASPTEVVEPGLSPYEEVFEEPPPGPSDPPSMESSLGAQPVEVVLDERLTQPVEGSVESGAFEHIEEQQQQPPPLNAEERSVGAAQEEGPPSLEEPLSSPEQPPPSTEQPPIEQPSSEQLPIEQPPIEQPSSEQPPTEQPPLAAQPAQDSGSDRQSEQQEEEAPVGGALPQGWHGERDEGGGGGEL